MTTADAPAPEPGVVVESVMSSRLEQLRKLVETAPDDPLSHYAIGLEYFNLKQWDDARAAFEKTLAVDGEYTAAYYHKARAEIRAGQRAAARATLAAGIKCAQAKGDVKTEREMRELRDTIQ
jgi:tetratricopeptide (TPR) repeat protein